MKNTLLYVDIGLKNSGGHHLVHAAAVEKMIEDIDWSVHFVGSNQGDILEKSPLKYFEGCFDVPMWIYYQNGGVKNIPKLFIDHVNLLAQNFENLKKFDKYEKIFIASATFQILRAFQIFIDKNREFANGRQFYFELNHSPELGMPRGYYGHSSTWYGHSIEKLRRIGVNINLLATDPWLKKDYQEILGEEVHEIALIRKIPQLKIKGRKKFLAFLGSQDRHKGYHYLPKLVEKFLIKHSDWSVFVHQSAQNNHPLWLQVDAELSKAQELTGRVQFFKGALDEENYQEVLDQIGLICMPYDPIFYSRAPSGIAQEAIINAIPFVGPKNTTINEMASLYGYPADFYEKWDIDSILENITTAIRHIDSNENIRSESAIKIHQKINQDSLANFLKNN
jgi:hypothetical protein